MAFASLFPELIKLIYNEKGEQPLIGQPKMFDNAPLSWDSSLLINVRWRICFALAQMGQKNCHSRPSLIDNTRGIEGKESENVFHIFHCITRRIWWRGNEGSVGMATEHWDTTETLCDITVSGS